MCSAPVVTLSPVLSGGKEQRRSVAMGSEILRGVYPERSEGLRMTMLCLPAALWLASPCGRPRTQRRPFTMSGHTPLDVH
jgi:hypothetical protein